MLGLGRSLEPLHAQNISCTCEFAVEYFIIVIAIKDFAFLHMPICHRRRILSIPLTEISPSSFYANGPNAGFIFVVLLDNKNV